MKQITLYKCEICGTEYKFSKDAEACEKYHVKPAVKTPIAVCQFKPYHMQACGPYPFKISVKMNDGKTIEYRR